MQRIFLLCISGYLLLISGCTSRSHDENAAPLRVKNAYPQASSYSVTLIDQQGLKNIIGVRNGKILLLNFWATWCQPCMEEFPDLIHLAQSDTLVELVGVSVDYPDELRSKVLPSVEKLCIPFRVYVARMEKQEDFISSIDTAWSGAIPATFIYDASGRKQFSHIGMGTIELFKKKLQEIQSRQIHKTPA